MLSEEEKKKNKRIIAKRYYEAHKEEIAKKAKELARTLDAQANSTSLIIQQMNQKTITNIQQLDLRINAANSRVEKFENKVIERINTLNSKLDETTAILQKVELENKALKGEVTHLKSELEMWKQNDGTVLTVKKQLESFQVFLLNFQEEMQ